MENRQSLSVSYILIAETLKIPGKDSLEYSWVPGNQGIVQDYDLSIPNLFPGLPVLRLETHCVIFKLQKEEFTQSSPWNETDSTSTVRQNDLCVWT